MSETIIAGAGLAGLITGCLLPHAQILEAGLMVENHRALLRFRDESVSRATGIPFKHVRVHKSIWANGTHYATCNPSLANRYATKVTGAISGDRSIWNLDTVTRYVAPESFYHELCHRLRNRISWETPMEQVVRGQSDFKIVSTIPLPLMMKLTGLDVALSNTPVALNDMEAAPIDVRRFRLPQGSNVYQTVYFPDQASRMYRASITGDLLIIESISRKDNRRFAHYSDRDDLSDACEAFGINLDDLHGLDNVDQKYGKIVDIPRQHREALLYELTRDYNVFSVGRFATWRNILLDDVVKDVCVVKRLMDASAYGRDLVVANR